MAKVIMVQGTMSNVGKSFVAAGLCRVFRQEGYRVFPFKSQNMALNSYITKEGLEMGRAQVMQAEAAGVEPQAAMNPILLKPTSDMGSQVIVNGEVLGNMSAREYFARKKSLIPTILRAYRRLEEQADILVIEGAGSPAEINLKADDIVNMGMAKLVDAPVLLVGDIDRGGVFAQLLGTLMLLEKDERARVKGLIINKFRGDKSILEPGVQMLEERGGVPVSGVLPYMNISLDDEDSLSRRFDRKEEGIVNIAVIRFPRISNFTDLSAFEQIDGVSVHYVDTAAAMERADLVVLPGSKNTIGDLRWMRESGLAAAVCRFAEHRPVFGICGGYQMLGVIIHDPEHVEEGGSMRGLSLLNVETTLMPQKTRTQVRVKLGEVPGALSCLSHRTVEGYEIHMGQSVSGRMPGAPAGGCDCTGEANGRQDGRLYGAPVGGDVCTGGNSGRPDSRMRESSSDALVCAGNVYGSYVHGFFDAGELAFLVADALARAKGCALSQTGRMDYRAFKEREYDRLADMVREHMDMKHVYQVMDEGA